MSEILAPFDVAPDVVEQPADVADASPRTPVLITEQQVQFATAAALPVQPAKSSRRWTEAPPRYRGERAGGIRDVQRRSPTEATPVPAPQ
ncbi:MAG TPA: hypothetical protein VN888_15800 [Mycobacterium sp.]|nr:hypothetical protein [Mycobacterium sp.]